ncbi:unnamed protein product [Lactuca virosa]|uniref:Uncharacterized protein n=1 Tax=Lactuca virosa TaxID=75947 RepID=A0AAU9LUH2_9ASTR|nr:unnamed protein product [Lactuca virosa]
MGLNLDSVAAAVAFPTSVPSSLRLVVRPAVVLADGLRRHLAPPSLAAVGTEETRWFQSLPSVESRISFTLRSVAVAASVVADGEDRRWDEESEEGLAFAAVS